MALLQLVGSCGGSGKDWGDSGMTPKQARVTILGNLAVWNVNGIIDQLESEYEKGVLREIVGAAEQLAKSTGWISVKDRLPNIGETVLSIDRDRDQVVAVFDGRAFFDDHGMGAGIKHFTHWMPLPEPPEKGE